MKLNKFYSSAVKIGRMTKDEAERFQERDEKKNKGFPKSMSTRPKRYQDK